MEISSDSARLDKKQGEVTSIRAYLEYCSRSGHSCVVLRGDLGFPHPSCKAGLLGLQVQQVQQSLFVRIGKPRTRWCWSRLWMLRRARRDTPSDAKHSGFVCARLKASVCKVASRQPRDLPIGTSTHMLYDLKNGPVGFLVHQGQGN